MVDNNLYHAGLFSHCIFQKHQIPLKSLRKHPGKEVLIAFGVHWSVWYLMPSSKSTTIPPYHTLTMSLNSAVTTNKNRTITIAGKGSTDE